jgi:histidine triad (HIT) family protein
MSSSIFTKIIHREIPAEIIWEDEKFIAFLSINPHAPGHTLVVPKVEIDKFYDLDDEIASDLFLRAKFLAKNLEKIYETKRVILSIEGFEVPHVHIHLIPSNEGLPIVKSQLGEIDLKTEAKKIRDFLSNKM